MNTEDIYTDYYMTQAGSGFGNIYAAPSFQKGYGVGSVLGGLFRGVIPLLKKSSKALGGEFLNGTVGIMRDVAGNETLETAVKKRGKEFFENLGRRSGTHMFGSGYNGPRFVKRKQSSSRIGGVKSKKRKTKTPRKVKKSKVSKKSRGPKKATPKRKKTFNDIFS